jgi:uncharacterized membrane protein YoaK (UPF0700 family)
MNILLIFCMVCLKYSSHHFHNQTSSLKDVLTRCPSPFILLSMLLALKLVINWMTSDMGNNKLVVFLCAVLNNSSQFDIWKCRPSLYCTNYYGLHPLFFWAVRMCSCTIVHRFLSWRKLASKS